MNDTTDTDLRTQIKFLERQVHWYEAQVTILKDVLIRALANHEITLTQLVKEYKDKEPKL